VSTVGPTMCFGGKKLTGRKESYGQPENQHCELPCSSPSDFVPGLRARSSSTESLVPPPVVRLRLMSSPVSLRQGDLARGYPSEPWVFAALRYATFAMINLSSGLRSIGAPHLRSSPEGALGDDFSS